MKRFISNLLIILLLTSLFTGCTKKEDSKKEESKELTKVTFVLDWTPNTNHTGIYAAKDLGYFEEEGLDVEIIQPSNQSAESLVAANKAQFGISYQEGVTFARLQDIPVVSIGAVIQHNTSSFASLKSKGINTPKDFEGKKYMGWGSDVEKATIKALMEKYDGDVNKVEILTGDTTAFIELSEKGDLDFCWIFDGWSGVEANLRDVELNLISLAKEDERLDYYTPVIITNEDNIANEKELVKKFMRAASKGYDYAINNHEKAGEILLKAAPELDKELVIESQKYLSPKYKDDADIWGVQEKERWENYTNWLFENKLIEKKIDVDKAFTNEFISEK